MNRVRSGNEYIHLGGHSLGCLEMGCIAHAKLGPCLLALTCSAPAPPRTAMCARHRLDHPGRSDSVKREASVRSDFTQLKAKNPAAVSTALTPKALPLCVWDPSHDRGHRTLGMTLWAPWGLGHAPTPTSTGKMVVESKADMKKRGMRSPDLADAFKGLSVLVRYDGVMWARKRPANSGPER